MTTMTKKQWENTHPDYKSVVNGQKYVLCLINGETILTPINLKK